MTDSHSGIISRNIGLLMILFLFLGTSGAMSMTSGDVRFRNLQTKDGLSNDDVNCVFKDSHGFIWIGTASGLNRYDGYYIKIYHSQRPDSTALRDNYVQGIQEDPYGKLWICAGDTYSVYDPRTDSFTWFGARQAAELGLPSEPDLILVNGKTLWFVVNDNVIYRYERGRDKKAVKVARTAPGISITDIAALPGRKDVAVVNERGELTVFTPEGRVTGSSRVFGSVTQDAQFFIFPDNDGRVWTYSVFGVSCFNLRSGRDVPMEICSELRGKSVKAIALDDSGNLWFGTDNNGIYILGKDGSIETMTYNPADAYALPNNTVKAIYNSGDGGMWIGTYKKGVSLYYPSEYKFLNRPFADVNCIARNPNEFGSVWVGTDHSGLMKYNYSTNDVMSVSDPRDPRHHAITALMTDSKGNLWIGTYLGGLKRYAGGRFEHWTTGNGLSSNNIWAILEGRDGRIWLGTLDGGIQVLDPVTNAFRTFDVSNSKLKSNYINTLAMGRDGSIYAGTTYGVARISPTDYSITTFIGSNKDKRDFSNLNINQVTVDSRGLLWIATREGLEVYDIKQDAIYDLRLSERFPNPFVLGVIEGADHTMWVTVGNEIFNITVAEEEGSRPYSFKVKSYGSHDGVVSGTFNQRSMCLLPSGEILAGTLEGILTINPQKIIIDTNRPRVIFTELSIKNVPVTVGKEYDGRVILPEALDYTDRISLDYDQNDITVYFSTDNYSNSTHTSYFYRLQGFDDEWISCAPGTHHATYTNLPPGTYTLEVKAINSDGIESEKASRLRITIRAPWWATWWAKTIYVLLAVVVLACVVLYFHRRMVKRMRRKQERELAEKTEELNQLKFKFFTNVSHELRTPLTLILSPVESMLKENPQEKNQRRLNTIKANAQRLLYLVNQLLDFRKNEMAGLTLHLSEGDIVSSIKSACDSFGEFTDRKDISLEFDSQVQKLDMEYDSDKLTKVLVNLLSNAVKYTPAGGRIDVRLYRDGPTVKVSVSDTGRGISDIDKQHIFERFYRGSDKSDLNTGTGIGLSLVYEYVKLHGGTVEVSDNMPQGTVFTVTLPCRECAGEQEDLRKRRTRLRRQRPSLIPKTREPKRRPTGSASRGCSLSTTTATLSTSSRMNSPTITTWRPLPTASRLSE